MNILRNNFDSLKNGCVATIGNFDGVHLAHQKIINKVIKAANEKNIPAVLITFEPHPAEFFLKNGMIPRITSLQEKIQQFKKLQIDYVVILRFNQQIANLSAKNFIEKYLLQKLNVKHLIVGDDFHFGRDRSGDFNILQTKINIVEKISTSCFADLRISSSRVRAALADGDFDLVENLLGRRFLICGRVMHGDKRGREIGFPTANVFVKKRELPLEGVYAVKISCWHPDYENEIKKHRGVANIGTRPTVKNSGRRHLEVFIFDFNEDIYEWHIKVEFVKKIRSERKFASLVQLKQQIERDIFDAKNSK